MHLEFFIVAQGVSVDQDTNQTSIFGVLEEVASPVFPHAIPFCVAVSLWNVSDADVGKDWQAALRIRFPDGNETSIPINFSVKDGTRRHRITQRMMGLPVPGTGDLEFELLLNGKHAATHTTTVRAPTAQELAALAPAPSTAPVQSH
jgi:hypothetical protein